MLKQKYFDKIQALGERIAEIENREFSVNPDVALRQRSRDEKSIEKCEKQIEDLKAYVCRSEIEYHKEHKIRYDNMRLCCYYCGFVAKRY